MADTVNELQIKVNAEASRANDAIDRLVGKLDRLTTALGSLNVSGSKLSSLSVGVKDLGTAMQTMNSVKTSDFTRLARNLQSLNSVDVSKFANISTNIKQMTNAFGSLTGIDKSVSQIASLADGIKQLGYKSADKAISNIPALASAMKKLMGELSTAPKVSQNLIDMTNVLARLARTGASSGKAANSLVGSFNKISKSSTSMRFNLLSAANGISAIRRSILQAMGVAGGFYAVIQGIRSAIDISSDLTEVQNVVDVTFGDYKQKMEDLAKASIPELGMSELTAKQIGSRYQAMGTAMGFAQGKMADMSVELTRLAGDMASFYNVEQEDVAKSLQSVFTGETEPMRKYGVDLTNATIQQYALKQGITESVSSMTQLQKATLRYQYVMEATSAAQGDFIRTADTWANQVRVLRENFRALAAIIGSSFISALKPMIKALNTAMSYVIEFAKVVSNSLGKIFGWTYEDATGGIADDFSSAADSADDLADGTGKAADNAKKLKQQLQGFDELNVLTTSDTGKSNKNSGVGAGIGSADASGGRWTETSGLLKGYESDLDTLYKLGDYIGGSLIDVMESIDWDSIYEKARGFGSGLASFLNGLFAGHNGITLFGAVGKTIASALNTVIYTALSFGQTFDFHQFGVNIADGINNFFRTFDFKALADTLNVWVDGLIELVGTVIKETDKGAILDGFIDFFSNLDIDTVGVVIGTFTVKKIGKVAWGFALTKVLQPLTSAFASNMWATLTADIGAVFGAGSFSGIAATIGTGLLGALAAWFVGQKVGSIIGRLMFPEDTSYYEDFHWFSEGGFFDVVSSDLSTSLDALRMMLSDFFGNDIVKGFAKSVSTMVGGPIVEIGTKVAEVVSSISGMDSIETWFKTKVSPWFAENKWSTLAGVIHQTLSGGWNKFSDWWASSGVNKWWSNSVSPWFTKEKWSSVADNMKSGITQKWNEFSEWWNSTGIHHWYEDSVKPWFSPEKWSFSGIKDGIVSAWQGAIATVKQMWNTLANSLNNILKVQINPIVVAGKTIFSGGVLNLGHIPTFANGGFPEDGWFRASQGEMMGKFDNGKSVVANNNQITSGISDAVQKGNQQMISYMQQEIEELRQQNNYLMQIASKNFGVTRDQIGQSARSWAMEYTARTGNEAYSF